MSLFQAARSVIQTLLGVWLFNDLFTTYVLLFIYCLQAFRFLSRLPLQSTSFLPPLYKQHTMLTRDLFRPFLQQSRAVHLDHRSGNYVLYMGKVHRICAPEAGPSHRHREGTECPGETSGRRSSIEELRRAELAGVLSLFFRTHDSGLFS